MNVTYTSENPAKHLYIRFWWKTWCLNAVPLGQVLLIFPFLHLLRLGFRFLTQIHFHFLLLCQCCYFPLITWQHLNLFLNRCKLVKMVKSVYSFEMQKAYWTCFWAPESHSTSFPPLIPWCEGLREQGHCPKVPVYYLTGSLISEVTSTIS